jgi:hypothetical protein
MKMTELQEVSPRLLKAAPDLLTACKQADALFALGIAVMASATSG